MFYTGTDPIEIQTAYGPVQVRAQSADVLLVTTGVDGHDYALTFRGVKYRIHQHIYRHADGWKHYSKINRFGTLFLSRENSLGADNYTEAAGKTCREMLATLGEAVETDYPELLSTADAEKRMSDIADRREIIGNAQLLINALKQEIRDLERGGTAAYADVHYSSGYSDQAAVIVPKRGAPYVAAKWDKFQNGRPYAPESISLGDAAMRLPSAPVMIARRVRSGAPEDESRTLLAELRAEVSPQNLPAALLYQGFLTPAQAEKASVER